LAARSAILLTRPPLGVKSRDYGRTHWRNVSLRGRAFAPAHLPTSIFADLVRGPIEVVRRLHFELGDRRMRFALEGE
jgi:hypothetical protein